MNKTHLANILYLMFLLSSTIELKPCQSLISYSVVSGISGYCFGKFSQNILRYRQDQQVNECKSRCLQAPENTEEDLEYYKKIEPTFKNKDALDSYYRSHYHSYILKDIKDKKLTLKNWNHSLEFADKKIKNFIKQQE